MSLFSRILDKLGLRKDKEEESTSTGTAGKAGVAGKPSGTAPKTPSTPKPTGTARTTATSKPAASRGTGGASAETTGMGSGRVDNAAKQPAGTGGAAAPAAPKAMSNVDVMNMLEQKARGTGLNWKQSISDLLFLLDLDNSREARTELAQELGAPQDVMGDSARMNTWLHKEVLRRIAANGGNIPQEMLD